MTYKDAEKACQEALQFVEVATGKKFSADHRKIRLVTFILADLQIWPEDGVRPEMIEIRRELMKLIDSDHTEDERAYHLETVSLMLEALFDIDEHVPDGVS